MTKKRISLQRFFGTTSGITVCIYIFMIPYRLWCQIFFFSMGTTPKKEFYSSFYRPIDIKMTRNMRNIYPLFTILVHKRRRPFIHRMKRDETISVHCHVHKNIYKLFIAVSFLMGANFFLVEQSVCWFFQFPPNFWPPLLWTVYNNPYIESIIIYSADHCVPSSSIAPKILPKQICARAPFFD